MSIIFFHLQSSYITKLCSANVDAVYRVEYGVQSTLYRYGAGRSMYSWDAPCAQKLISLYPSLWVVFRRLKARDVHFERSSSFSSSSHASHASVGTRYHVLRTLYNRHADPINPIDLPDKHIPTRLPRIGGICKTVSSSSFTLCYVRPFPSPSPSRFPSPSPFSPLFSYNYRSHRYLK